MRQDRVAKKNHALDSDGISFIGEQLNNGDIYVNKKAPSNKTQQIDHSKGTMSFQEAPAVYKGPVGMTVDKVIMTQTNEEPLLLKHTSNTK